MEHGWGTISIITLGGVFLNLKIFNLTGIAGGYLNISLSLNVPLLKQYKKSGAFAPQFS